jgi:hypothetical protein
MTESPHLQHKASAAYLPQSRMPSKQFGLLYAIAAVLFAAGFLWFRHTAGVAAEEAIRDYGHNIDSGAWLAIIGTLYLLPAAIICAVTSVAMFRGWRFGLAFHLITWTWIVSPFLLVLASQLRSAVAA